MQPALLTVTAPAPAAIQLTSGLLAWLEAQRGSGRCWGLLLGRTQSSPRRVIVETALPMGDEVQLGTELTARPGCSLGLFAQGTESSCEHLFAGFDGLFPAIGSVFLLLAPDGREAKVYVRERAGQRPEAPRDVIQLAVPSAAASLLSKQNLFVAWGISALLATPVIWLVLKFGKPDQQPGLHLGASRSGNGLQLVWDRNPVSERTAEKGWLEIEDAGAKQRIALSPAAMQSGSTFYEPQSANVSLHLILEDKNGPLSEGWLKVVEPNGKPHPGPVRSAASTTPTEPAVVHLPVKGIRSIVQPPMVAAWRPVHGSSTLRPSSAGARLEAPISAPR